jgi:hypothetical protein
VVQMYWKWSSVDATGRRALRGVRVRSSTRGASSRWIHTSRCSRKRRRAAVLRGPRHEVIAYCRCSTQEQADSGAGLGLNSRRSGTRPNGAAGRASSLSRTQAQAGSPCAAARAPTCYPDRRELPTGLWAKIVPVALVESRRVEPRNDGDRSPPGGREFAGIVAWLELATRR